jgi:hypothetical protein
MDSEKNVVHEGGLLPLKRDAESVEPIMGLTLPYILESNPH